jgi:prepilin-type processing-associated H-X9-DG protein/prepilin-type N-terminal cleavage/methylation domain-containing protein
MCRHLKPRESFSDQTHKAFTLAEVLVVTAIIAILIALIMPAMLSLKEKGYAVRCTANLKNLAQGINTYAGENNGRYPRLGQVAGPNNPPYWGEMIDPFVGRHSKAYLCPAQDGKWAVPDEDEKQPASLGFTYSGAWYAGITYGINLAVGAMVVGGGNYPQVTVGKIARPTKTVLLTDSWNDRGNVETGVCFVTGHPGTASYLNPGGWPSFVSYRHGGKANVCFVDGHVESLSAAQLMPDEELPPSDPEYSLWDFN